MSRIRADQLVNRAGSGGPKFPHGVAEGFSVSGVVTATSYRGDGSQLTGIDASSLKHGSNVKVQAHSTGASVTGDVAATGNVSAVNGTFSGNATVQGNLTVNGTTTTIDTAVTAVDSLAVDGSVGIGTTNPGNFNGNADDLVIFGTGHQGLTIRSGAAHDGSIMFNDTDNANQRGIIRYIHTDDAMAFHTSGGEAVRIKSDGKIGFNAVNPPRDYCFHSGQADTNIQITNHTTGIDDSAGALIQQDGNDLYIWNKENSFMSLGTNAGERLRITSAGDILPGADNTQDLGSSAKRFANIYTGDLNLSNEGSANDVDGTWGQYTIQEGEDDLFLINRRTGKKYKFNLTEVN